MGVVLLPISYKDRTRVLSVFVVRYNGPSLLGRDFIREFDLELVMTRSSAHVHAVYTHKGSDLNVAKDLFKMFPKVFSNSLGSFNNYTIKLHLKPDVKPNFVKLDRCLMHLKKK